MGDCVILFGNRPIRLTQCCTQFKPLGNKTFCFRNFHIMMQIQYTNRSICFRGLIYCDRTWLLFLDVQVRLLTRGAIHSTKIPTGPIGKSGPPQKVDPFFRNFSCWTEPIHWVLDRHFRKFWLNGSLPRCEICFTLGLSNYFSLRRCPKSHMNEP